MKSHNLNQICIELRKKILKMHTNAGTSHIGSTYSCVEIMATLYFRIMNINFDNPVDSTSDRFILSKGHAISGLYAILAQKKLVSENILDNYYCNGSRILGHPDRLSNPFIQASTGSLGHGLSIGTGISYSFKLDNKKNKVFVLMSDGEIQEGSVWEAANTASRLKLDNLTAIIDLNKLQAYEWTNNIMPHDSIRKKWEAFGWEVDEIDGHDIDQLSKALKNCPLKKDKPTIIIANTTKGSGIKEFENKLEWHYRSPKPEKYDDYIKELNEKSIY